MDSESSDLQRLTELEFEGQDVEFVEAVYMRSVALIERTRVAFVTRADDPPSQIIIERCLKPERIVEIQRKVLAGGLVPGY